ncbi:MAG: alpha-L-fucosidase [Cytophagales bacterium]|nr:alpha-L-fucosidase [Cytophagales bacterium]
MDIFSKKVILRFSLVFICLSFSPLSGIFGQSEKRLPTPSPEQILWQDMEQTMFICLDPCTWEGVEQGNHTYPISKINPTKLDVNQWLDAAEAFGAKMVLFVAKHSSGFCWWNTETTDYGIRNTPYKNGKGDILKELSDACWQRGIKLGIYVYPGDLTWGAYLGGAGRTEDPTKQEGYNEVLRQQWREVLSRYGEATEIWFDGNCIIPIDDIKEEYAPNAIVFGSSMANIRWVGNERGFAPYPAWNTVKKEDGGTGAATAAHSDPNGDMWMPLEVNTTLKDHYWFWSAENEKHLKSFDHLLECYYKSVGRGGVFLLNSAPDTSGLIPEADMKLYQQLGEEIRTRFSKSIKETSGKGEIVSLDLKEITEIDHIIIMEDIAFGERVRKYTVEGTKDGNTWFEILHGISVGHKRIDKFKPVKVRKIRFRADEHAALPIIKKFAVYMVGDKKNYNSLQSIKDDFGYSWQEGQSKKYIDLVNVGKISRSSQRTNGRNFTVDLSKIIDRPGQYELFVANNANGTTNKPSDAVILLEGNETPGFCDVDRVFGRMNLNITAHPTMKDGSIKVIFNLADKIQEENVYLRKVIFN